MLMNIWQTMQNGIKSEAGAVSPEEALTLYTTAESQFIELQGMNIHYRDVCRCAEPEKAPVLILLHGIFSSLHTWNDWTDILSKDFRVISIDCPNFGLTGAHPQGMFKHLYSEFLNEFTDVLGIQHCSLAGNSLGGWMSWEFAGRYPHKVDKVILLDSAGFFFVPPPVLLSMGLPLSGWMVSMTPVPRKVMYSTIRTTYSRKERLSKEVMDRYYDLFMRAGNRAAGAAVLRFIRNHAGFDTAPLKKITQPVLIMWGRNDAWIPVAHAEKFAKALPQASTIIYDNCGHMPMEELPAESAADALRFLKG